MCPAQLLLMASIDDCTIVTLGRHWEEKLMDTRRAVVNGPFILKILSFTCSSVTPTLTAILVGLILHVYKNNIMVVLQSTFETLMILFFNFMIILAILLQL